MSHFEKSSTLRATPREVFDWHSRPGALARLTPPWQAVSILQGSGGIEEGSRVVLRLGRGPLSTSWTAEHTWAEVGKGFEDVQMQGPFRRWKHRHLFESVGENRCLLRDSIDYEIPMGFLGRWLAGKTIERSLERTFEYRHRTTVADLEFHSRFAASHRLRVGITGSGGLVGTALAALLTTGGHQVVRLIRRESSDKSGVTAVWDPGSGVLEPANVEGLDAVVHLAGDDISRGRWTHSKKARIRDSRVLGTRNLVESLGRLANPPRVFVSASAVGYYGAQSEGLVDERSPVGEGFLAEVCERWEEAACGATEWAERVVLGRFGVVLSPRGGALATMLPAFRWGGGGRLGDGRQFLSWICLDDAACALIHVLMSPEVHGPVNLVAPRAVRNREFTRHLGRILGRPTFLPLPTLVARLLFGQKADEILLAGCRVTPDRLLSSGFSFRHSELAPALSFLLGRR